MQYNTALGFLLGGAGLTALFLGKIRLVTISGAIVSTLSLLTLLEYGFGIDLGIDTLVMEPHITTKSEFPGRMAPFTALAHLLSALSLIFLGYAKSWERNHILIGITGSIVFAMGGANVLGYLAGEGTPFNWDHSSYMAVHTAAGFMLLGGGIFAASLKADFNREQRVPRWIAIPIGICALTVSLSLWQTLVSHERIKIASSTSKFLDSLSFELSHSLPPYVKELERMALRKEVQFDLSRETWGSDAEALVEDQPGLQAVEWVDSSGRIQWIVPLLGNEAALNFNLNKEPRRADTLSRAIRFKRGVSSRSIDLVQGGKGFLIVSAVNNGAANDGFIVGAFRFSEFLRPVLQQLFSNGYSFELFDGDEMIYDGGARTSLFKEKWAQEALVNQDGVNWRLRIWPEQRAIDQSVSMLPNIVLLTGALLALLLSLSVRFYQTARIQAHDLKLSNQEQLREIEERKFLQDKLLKNRGMLEIRVDERTQELKETNIRLVQEMSEREQVEQELRKSESNHRRLIHNLPEIVYSFSDKVGGIYYSPRVESILGYSPEHLIENPRLWHDSIHPDDLPMVNKSITESHNGKDFDLQYRIRDADGDWHWFHDRNVIIRGDKGEVIINGIAADITERKQDEALLHKSEERFRNFAETAADWFWETDSEHGYTYVSDRGPEILGISMEGILGKTRTDFVDEEKKPGATEKWRAHQGVLDSHRPFRDFEYRIKHPNGSFVYLSVSASPVFDDSGDFSGYRGSARDITERVAVEEQAVRAEERLIEAIESINDGFILHDAEDRLVLCNSRYREIYPTIADLCVPGITYSEMLRANIERGGVPESKGQEEQFFRDRLKAHQQCNGTDERNLVDGRWSLISENKTKRGEIVGIRTDITDLIGREEALRKSEELFSKAFHASPVLCSIVDPKDLRYVEVNETWLDKLGYARDEVVGKELNDLHFWIDLEERARFYKILDSEESVRDFPAQFWNKTGDVIDLLVSGERIEFGGLPRVMIVSYDITKIKQAEEEQKKSDRRLRELFANANDAIFIIDPNDGSILDVNKQACRYLGYSLGELLQMTINDLHEKELSGGYGKYAKRVFETGHFMVEAEHVGKDGSIVPVEISSRIMDYGDQRVVQSFVRDISERKLVEESDRKIRENRAQLAHVSRLSTMGEMTTGLAHELNQPLSAITTYAQACARDIEKGKINQEEILVDLGKISKQAIRAGDIIRWIRGFVRKQPPQKTELDINQTVQEVADFLNSEICENKIDLTVSLNESRPYVNADKTQIQQVIMNLASNGIESLSNVDGPRSLTLSTSLNENGAIEISVEDSGPGISKDANDKIFDAFFTTKDEGTGLGLSISKSIVEDIGSNLECKSEPGNGCKFFFAVNPLVHSEELNI